MCQLYQVRGGGFCQKRDNFFSLDLIVSSALHFNKCEMIEKCFDVGFGDDMWTEDNKTYDVIFTNSSSIGNIVLQNGTLTVVDNDGM